MKPTSCPHNLSVHGLEKSYRTGFRLGPLDFEIPRGSIVGLIGRNGSGKTTLIRLILGILKKDRGTISLFGSSSIPFARARLRIGYVDEEPLLYDWMTLRGAVRFYSSYFPTWDESLFSATIRRIGLDSSAKVGELSKGTKTKLAICLALSHRPLLLVMDEPTSGLDPVARQEILCLLRDFVRENPTSSVFLSSHITTDLEQLCDRAIILVEGKIARQGTTETLRGVLDRPLDRHLPVTRSPYFLERLLAESNAPRNLPPSCSQS